MQGCTWNNSLENVKWRVDVKAVGKTAAEINEPIAMFELKTKKGFVNEDLNKSKTSGDVVMLTMNREAIGNIITQFDAIKKKFEELA